MELIATSIEQLLAVPTPYGFAEALPAMAEHLTPTGQALAKWLWESDAICVERTIEVLVEEMSNVSIKAVDDDHVVYDDLENGDGEYVDHLGQKYAVTW